LCPFFAFAVCAWLPRSSLGLVLARGDLPDVSSVVLDSPVSWLSLSLAPGLLTFGNSPSSFSVIVAIAAEVAHMRAWLLRRGRTSILGRSVDGCLRPNIVLGMWLELGGFGNFILYVETE